MRVLFSVSHFHSLVSIRCSLLPPETMTVSTPLQLVPSGTHPPREPSLKEIRPTEIHITPGELEGKTAFVHSAPGSPPLLDQPANDQTEHSFVCDSPTPKHSTTSYCVAHPRVRRQIGNNSMTSATTTLGVAPPHSEEDHLSGLPTRSNFGAQGPAPGLLQGPIFPNNISTEAQPSPGTSIDTLMSPIRPC